MQLQHPKNYLTLVLSAMLLDILAEKLCRHVGVSQLIPSQLFPSSASRLRSVEKIGGEFIVPICVKRSKR